MRSTCQHRERGTGARRFIECETSKCAPVVIGNAGNLRSRFGPSGPDLARLARAVDALARGVAGLEAQVRSLRGRTPRRRVA